MSRLVCLTAIAVAGLCAFAWCASPAVAEAPAAIANKTLIVTWPWLDFPHYVYVAASGRIFHHHTDPKATKLIAGGSEYTIGKTERTARANDEAKTMSRHSEATAGWSGRTLTLKETVHLSGYGYTGRPHTVTDTFEVTGETCTAQRRVAGPGDHKSVNTATSCKVVTGNQMPR
jgi:hypothetical protein